VGSRRYLQPDPLAPVQPPLAVLRGLGVLPALAREGVALLNVPALRAGAPGEIYAYGSNNPLLNVDPTGLGMCMEKVAILLHSCPPDAKAACQQTFGDPPQGYSLTGAECNNVEGGATLKCTYCMNVACGP